MRSWQRYRSKKHNVFTEEVNNIALGANDEKSIQSIHSIEKYAHGTSTDLIHKTGKNKWNYIIKQCKKWLIVTKENIKQHNSNWLQIPND